VFDMTAIKVFVRQPLTQTTEREARIVQAALDGISGHVGDGRYALEFLTGTKAHDKESFRQAFTSESGGAFAPRRFRDTRLALRTGLSESGAFEVAYNIYGGRRIPMLFAVWDEAEIKTTLLRDLDDLAQVRYVRFSDPASVATELARFLDDVVVPDMTARGRTLEPAMDEPRIARSFREARRAARELGFPVAVRAWSALPSQSVVVSDLAGLVRFVEGDRIAIDRERPLLLERMTSLQQARAKRVRVESGTFETAPAYREIEAKTA
jgi:hypothetical protein